jgi:hypothetical protein
MLLKASQRSGTRELAAHLLNTRDNDHIELYDLRGFAAADLTDAFDEIEGQARGTKVKKPLFSVSLSPPQEAEATYEHFEDAIAQIETTFGLENQPRAVVFHEKKGRRHAHVVWSLIDTERQRGLEVKFYKNRLMKISRELYLKHGWTLPAGLRRGGKGRVENYTMAEAKRAARAGLNPEEFKRMVRETLDRSDGLKAFEAGLAEKGLYLAKGSRGFCVVDHAGGVHALARVTGYRKKEVEARLGSPHSLPDVDQVQSFLQKQQQNQRLKRSTEELKRRQAAEKAALVKELEVMKERQREARRELARRQAERKAFEEFRRAERIRGGLTWLFEKLPWRQARAKKQAAREREETRRRDLAERQGMSRTQRQERLELQRQLKGMETRHAFDLATLQAGIMRDTTERGDSLREAFARNQQRETERSSGREQDTGRTLARAFRP